MTRYKFLRLIDGKLKSNSGDTIWALNEWKHEDKIDLCNSGFHCSIEKYHAFSYVQGEVLAEVEVKGESVISEDKEVYSDMRVIKTWKWQKKDSVALAIYAAELCIGNYEKVCPEDKRPRQAIESAKKWLADPSEENILAARWSAGSAGSAAESTGSAWWSAWWSAAESARWSAWSARWSAWSAAESARSAAESAGSAGSAAESARSAAESAGSAWSAAESARSAAESAGSAGSARWSAGSAATSARSARWSAAESARWSAVYDKFYEWINNRKLEIYESNNL